MAKRENRESSHTHGTLLGLPMSESKSPDAGPVTEKRPGKVGNVSTMRLVTQPLEIVPDHVLRQTMTAIRHDNVTEWERRAARAEKVSNTFSFMSVLFALVAFIASVISVLTSVSGGK